MTMEGFRTHETPVDRQLVAKPSFNRRTVSIAQVSGIGQKSSGVRKLSVGTEREIIDGISAIDLNHKAKDSRGKERNWAIMRFEAKLAKATDFPDARRQQTQLISARTQPNMITSQLITAVAKQQGKITSHTTHVKATKPKLGYFLLPAEIRNMIMDYFIVHGEVFLSTNRPPVEDFSSPTLLMSGWQFLATCKQAYLEAGKLYSLNKFHLAPSPLFATANCFIDWDTRLQDVVRHVTMDLSIVDLTPAVMNHIEAAFYSVEFKPIAEAPNTVVAHYVRNALLDLWAEKIAGIRNTRSIKTVRLVRMYLCDHDRDDTQYSQWPSDLITVEGKQIQRSLKHINPSPDCRDWRRDPARSFSDDFKDWNPKISMLLHCMLKSVERLVLKRLRLGGFEGRAGWVALKAWLETLEVSSMESPYGFFHQNLDR